MTAELQTILADLALLVIDLAVEIETTKRRQSPASIMQRAHALSERIAEFKTDADDEEQ
jgi:hypothetical protein